MPQPEISSMPRLRPVVCGTPEGYHTSLKEWHIEECISSDVRILQIHALFDRASLGSMGIQKDRE
jgi:hypothetical protein